MRLVLGVLTRRVDGGKVATQDREEHEQKEGNSNIHADGAQEGRRSQHSKTRAFLIIARRVMMRCSYPTQANATRIGVDVLKDYCRY